jgi:hypothetical protein
MKNKKEYFKAYREANKDKIAEQKKAYYEANKEYFKAYREANKDKIAEQKKTYYEANKDKIAEQNKAYYEANKEYFKAYYEANKDKIKAYREANKDKIRAKERKITKELKLIKNKLKEKMLNEIYQRVKEEELGNQSPTYQISPNGDFSNEKEHNISLKTTPSAPSKLPTATSLNNNIKSDLKKQKSK